MSWQLMDSAPRDIECLFVIVPKTADESYVNTNDKPIVSAFEPCIDKCKYGSWSSLSKAVLWMPLPRIPWELL